MTEHNMKERKGEHPFGDAGQLILFALFIIVWTSDSFFLHLSTSCSKFAPFIARLIVFISFFIISLLLFRSSHAVVSHDQRPSEIISTGAFAYVRHPLYLAVILFYLSLTVLTCSLLSLGLFFVIFLFYNFIGGYEEQLMVRKFGEKYLTYMRNTGKWFPRPRRDR